MKVVLRDDVENLGHKGDLIEVSDGYARNYLVPRGLALRATKGVVQQSEAMRRSREAHDRRERESADAVAARLVERQVELRVRAGEGGRLFGSVTSADVAEAVSAQLGVEIDRRKVALDEPLKTLGEFEVEVRLHSEVTATLRLAVVEA